MTKTPIPRNEALKIVRGRSKEFSAFEIKKKTSSVIERLIDADDFIYADKIFMYLSTIPEIVNTHKLIEYALGCGKSVFLPKPDPSGNLSRFQFSTFEELVKDKDGFYAPRLGIEEDLSDIDLIIVPCVAVSLFGQLLGCGKVNYNMILRNNFSVKYALAFEFQIFHRIEYERRDLLIDRIITEKRIINTREN